jgi:hypothetical protein
MWKLVSEMIRHDWNAFNVKATKLCVSHIVNQHILLLQRFATLECDNIVEDEVMLLRAEQRYLHWLAYLHKRRPGDMPVPPLGK